jgi:hypothetical protein
MMCMIYDISLIIRASIASLSGDWCDGVLSGPLEFNFFGLRIAAHSSLQVDQPEGMALAACESSLQSECKMALVTEVFGQDCGTVHWLWRLISATRKPPCARGIRRICIAFGLHFIVCKKYYFSPTYGSHVLFHLTCSPSFCIPSVLTSKTLTCAASHAAQGTPQTFQVSYILTSGDVRLLTTQHLSHCPSASQKRQLEAQSNLRYAQATSPALAPML